MKNTDLQMKQRLVEGLFETTAIRVAPVDRPFWYTSGKLGPVYINTHFLYGSEEAASNLLKVIDENLCNKLALHKILIEETEKQYESNSIFQNLINDMVTYIKENIGVDSFEYISGGERRDWFFSLQVARLLGKRHITIFKDLSMVFYEDGEILPVSGIDGSKVLHIVDLITEASSYERAWIPAIKSLNCTITHSLTVIDRKQGGSELLKNNGIVSHAMCDIDFELFVKAVELGCISEAQCAILKEYLHGPDASMKNFIKSNPDFLLNELNGDNKKNAERARLCIEKGFYN